MTTIAYKHEDKEIAVDSRRTRGDLIVSDREIKFKKVGELTFIFCGYVCENEIIIDAWLNGDSGNKTTNGAFVIDSGVVYRCGIDSDDGFWKEELTCDDSIGSGSSFAIAAMDLGKSAKQAVEYAKTRDVNTGGKVHLFNIGSKPKKK